MIRDTLKALIHAPVTQLYPTERLAAPPALRGMLHYTPEGCTGCQLCVKDCPAQAIELITIDRAAKRFVMKYYTDRCTFCGQCVVNCRFDCLTLESDEWELASDDRTKLTVYYGRDADLATLDASAPESADADAECDER
jgi:formate hydrogenlyase subunit 6/NADH:ubiquinone oxidoreductase subunit I